MTTPEEEMQRIKREMQKAHQLWLNSRQGFMAGPDGEMSELINRLHGEGYSIRKIAQMYGTAHRQTIRAYLTDPVTPPAPRATLQPTPQQTPQPTPRETSPTWSNCTLVQAHEHSAQITVTDLPVDELQSSDAVKQVAQNHKKMPATISGEASLYLNQTKDGRLQVRVLTADKAKQLRVPDPTKTGEQAPFTDAVRTGKDHPLTQMMLEAGVEPLTK